MDQATDFSAAKADRIASALIGWRRVLGEDAVLTSDRLAPYLQNCMGIERHCEKLTNGAVEKR